MNKKKKLDPSTLNFNRVEEPNSQKTSQNRFVKNLHVKQTVTDIDRMIIPRGFDIRVHGFNIHKNRLAEGSLITIYCDNINPNILCRREKEELDHFISQRFKIINENPYELRGMDMGNTKIITEIDTEEKAQKAFNLEKQGKRVLGRL